MLDRVTLYVVVEDDAGHRIQAVCDTQEEAEETREEIRQTFGDTAMSDICITRLNIFAMNAVFPGDRYRMVYGTPECRPRHPLEVPPLQYSRMTNTDAHSEGYVYPDELYLDRKKALAAAARHNSQQLKRPEDEALDWVMVVEVGEPLWRRYRSECLVRKGVGWEDADLVRPVRIVQPTPDEASLPPD
jgi:hypothetical protein